MPSQGACGEKPPHAQTLPVCARLCPLLTGAQRSREEKTKTHSNGLDNCGHIEGLYKWLLLDSRVVDVRMSSNPTCVTLSSLKTLFFNGLRNE